MARWWASVARSTGRPGAASFLEPGGERGAAAGVTVAGAGRERTLKCGS